jgi:type IV secretion system protein VirB5
MKIKVNRIAALVSIAAISVSPVSHAQWAVVDVGAIAQLVQQLSTMEQQLGTMQNHLRQAQQEYQSITGSRGMQSLLTGTVRNYLPADWQELRASLTSATSSYPALSAAVQQALNANAVLSAPQLSMLSATERNQVMGSRQSVAMLQATTQQALATISGRFASIQQLINAIGTARDQKAILDLQARISAEQGMLVNDESKLQVIYQAAQAQQWASQQKSRELALSDIGSLRSLPAMGL